MHRQCDGVAKDEDEEWRVMDHGLLKRVRGFPYRRKKRGGPCFWQVGNVSAPSATSQLSYIPDCDRGAGNDLMEVQMGQSDYCMKGPQIS